MNLVIDGNAFINVAISVTKSLSFKDKRFQAQYWVEDLFNEGKFILRENVRISFRNFCVTYLNSILAPIGPAISSVHFVFDSKSWRHAYLAEYFKDNEISDEDSFVYKGDRPKDQFQYLFFDFFHKKFIPILKETCGVNVYSLPGTEGDDLIAYLCEKLSGDIIIYSVDQDLKQLVGFPGKNVLLITPKQSNRTKRIFLPQTFVSNQSLDDDFFSISEEYVSSSTLQTIIKNFKSKDFEENLVNLNVEIISKILDGDKSDKIPRVLGITPSKSKKIIDEIFSEFTNIFEKVDLLDPDFIDTLAQKIISLNKNKLDLDQIRKSLILNIKLIRLNKNLFPENIQESLDIYFSNYSFESFSLREFSNLKNKISTL
jgi:5'-3' exonuclease